MILPFFKYHGAGNDFIILDGRFRDYQQLIPQLHATIEGLCHRHTGIGADGLMILERDPLHDFRMLYFNSDGYEGTMCGNGGRCLVAFARHLGMIDQQTRFMASDGVHDASIIGRQHHEMVVALGMKDIHEIRQVGEHWFLDTGSPHLICFTDQLETLDVITEGRRFRHSEPFMPEGTNVNFVQIAGQQLLIRTYERGVENETLACGTGITAAAIAAHHAGLLPLLPSYAVKARGGDLQVSFKLEGGIYQKVILQGPAVQVFKGEIAI